MVSRWGRLALVALAVLTYSRVWVWRDDRSLWRAAVRVTPHSPRAWLNLGAALEPHDEWAALEAYESARVLVLDPGRRQSPFAERFVWAAATTNLGRLLALHGELAEARTLVADVQAKEPNFAYAREVAEWLSGEPRAVPSF